MDLIQLAEKLEDLEHEAFYVEHKKEIAWAQHNDEEEALLDAELKAITAKIYEIEAILDANTTFSQE